MAAEIKTEETVPALEYAGEPADLPEPLAAEQGDTSRKPGMVGVYPVYVVYCRLPVSIIDKRLRHYGPVGFIRIVFEAGQDGPKETDRNIVLLQPETYNKLVADGYGERNPTNDLRIASYQLSSRDYPNQFQLNALFVPVPPVWANADLDVHGVVTDKLKLLVEWGIIKDGSYKVSVPVHSRQTGGVKGGCHINFEKDVTLEQIAMVRVILTDTYWPDIPQQKPSEPKGKGKGKGKEEKAKAPEPVPRAVFHCRWQRDPAAPPRPNAYNARAAQSVADNQQAQSPSAASVPILPQIQQPRLVPANTTPSLPKLTRGQFQGANKAASQFQGGNQAWGAGSHLAGVLSAVAASNAQPVSAPVDPAWKEFQEFQAFKAWKKTQS